MQPNVRMALNPHELPATTIRVLRFFFAAHARRGGLQNAGRTTVRRNRIRPRGSRSFQLVELSPDLFSLSHRSARFVGRRGSVRCELWDGTVQGSFDGCFRFLWALLLRAVVSCVRARSNGKGAALLLILSGMILLLISRTPREFEKSPHAQYLIHPSQEGTV